MPIKDVFLAVATVALWGVFPVFCKLGLAYFPPMMVGGLRFLFASLPFIFIFKRPTIPFRAVAGMGIILTLHTASFMLALRTGIGAGLTSILMESQVFFTMLLSILVLKNKISLQQLMGLILAFSGVVLIGLSSSVENGGLIGFLYLLMSAFFWGISNVQMNHYSQGDALSLVVWISLFPPIPLFALSYFFETQAMIQALQNISLQGISIILFLSVISGVWALWMWCGLLRRNDPSLVAPFALLSPVVGVIVAGFVFQEYLSVQAISGAVLILLGLLYLQVVTYRQKRLYNTPHDTRIRHTNH